MQYEKHINYIYLSILAFLSINATSPASLAVEKKEDIDLKGRDKSDREKSLVIPFQAWLVDNEEVEVLSYHAYADVIVSISTVSGQVLNPQTLSFASMQSVTFNLANYAEGYYLVKISTPSGTEFSGTFFID